MDQADRTRRVAQLCPYCLRNIAFYRAGWRNGHVRVQRAFWISINGNALEIAVLEWCKLFADRKGKGHWRRVVLDDQDAFHAALLARLQCDHVAFHEYAAPVRSCRDKFIAHLDDEHVMHIPRLRLMH